MKNLHFKEYFQNYLYELDYFITIYENNLHVYNYQKLTKLSEQEIILNINNKKVIINGNNLKIKQMTKQELLIYGEVLKVAFTYE